MACNLIQLRTKLLSELNDKLQSKQISKSQYEKAKSQIELSVYTMRMNSKENLFNEDEINKKINELTSGSAVQENKKSSKSINIYSTDKNGYESLSNLSPREFIYDDRQYHSVEHAYQTLKSGNYNPKVDKAYNKRYEAGATLGKISDDKLGVDKTKSEQLIKDLIKTSLEQNPELKDLLLSTGDSKLTHTQEKSNWKNLFPKVMMEVRSELSLPQNKTKEQEQNKKQDVDKDHTSVFGSHADEFKDTSEDVVISKFEDMNLHDVLDNVMNALNYESIENQNVSDEYKQFFGNMKSMLKNIYDGMNAQKIVTFEILKTNDEFTNMSYEENLYEDGNTFDINGKNAIYGGKISIRYGKGFDPIGVDENGNPVNKQGSEDTALSDFNSHREMLMHEVLHSALEKAFEFDPKFRQSVTDLQAMFKKKITKDSLVKTLKEMKGNDVKATDDSLYRQADIISGYINGKPTEFMTHALSNAVVFEILRKSSMQSRLIDDMNRSQNESRFVKIAQKFIDIINKVYNIYKNGGKNPISELGKLLQEAAISDVILSNMSVADRQAQRDNKDIQFESYEMLGLSEKYKNLDERFKKFNAKTFDKILNMNAQYKPGEKIEKFASWMNRFEFIKDSREKGRFRFFSDLMNTIVEDTTNRETGSAEFYELYRKIKGNRDRDKVELAQVAKNNIDKLWSGSKMTKEERQAATYMLQGDWRALDTDLDGLVDLLEDETSLQNSINILKTEIGNVSAVNDAKHLGYYSIYRTSKTGNLKRNAEMIYSDNMLSSDNTNQEGRLDYPLIKKIDMLASMYSLKYMNQETKDGIISAIKKDKEVVQTTSNMYYSYRDSQNSKFKKSGLGKYVDKGLIRYGSEVEMKIEILPESQIINTKLFKHEKIREVEAVSDAAVDIHTDSRNRGTITGEKYFLVMSRDYAPSRTQGGYDDIRLVDNGISLKQTLGLTSTDEFKNSEKDFFKGMQYFKNQSNEVNMIDDSQDSMFNLRDQIVPSYDIYGNIADYEIPVSDYDYRTKGRKSVDIADTVSSTISHINSKEQAITNNAMFTKYLVSESERNIGKPGYVLLRPSTKKEIAAGIRHKYDEEWAMIPNYIQEMIIARDSNGNPTREGIWVKEGRINNIIGYKDVSIANLKLFGKGLDKHPEIQKFVQMIEYFFKNLAGRYKEHIVKLFPVVVFGNAASNAFTAMRHGISPTEYYKSFTKNWTELTSYLELNEKLISLELMQKSGKKGLSYEIESLKKQLDENGFSSLINDGQFSTIMEDLNTNESLSKRSHFDDLIKQKVDKSSKFVQNAKDVWDTLYIGKGTRLHHAVEKLTIYNDIINKRIIEEKLNQDLDSLKLSPDIRKLREQDNRNYLDQLFVNYSYLDNKYLKYMNDINLFMFTKYMFRALKGNLSMMSRYPLGSLGFEAFDNTILNVPDAMQQYFNPIDSITNRAFANPIEMFLDMLVPHSLGIVVGH